jgi:N-acetylneuraminate synthase
VDVAADAGANAVKFQSFKAHRLVTKTARKADYQLRMTSSAETQYEMIRRLELTREMHFALKERCVARGIEFLSTPFDPDSLDFLVNSVGLDGIKLPSGEVVNGPLLLHAVRCARRVLLSTGMSNLGEIDAAIRVMAWGIAHPERTPTSRREVTDFVIDEDTAASLRQRVTLLHCTTEYPSRFEDVNLRAMDTMAHAFGLPVGFSDHTPGIFAPIAAAARGAVVIEKHFTLDRTLVGPDHAASLEADELSAMVAGIRAVELALGDGQKQARPAELSNRDIVRKSLVARHPIIAGEIIDADSIDFKRPGTGRSPMDYWDMLGAPALRDYGEDDLL